MRIGMGEEEAGRTMSAFALFAALPLFLPFAATCLRAQQPEEPAHASSPRIVYGDLRKVKGLRGPAWSLCTEPGHAEQPDDTTKLQQLAGVHHELGFQFVLGDTAVADADPASWITTDSRGVQALLWNESPSKKHSVAAKPAQFRLEHVAAGDYTLELFRTTCGASEVFTSGLKSGASPAFSAGEIADLRKAATAAPTLRRTVAIDPRGYFSMEIPLSQNELVLVLLSKEAK